jgi:protein SCO1/2
MADSLPPARSRIVRLAGSPLFWAAVALVAALAPLWRSFPRALAAIPPVLGTLPEFRLKNQAGQPFGSQELRGTVYVADFVFVSCSEVCPRLTAKMKKLQDKLGQLPRRTHLVTFTVDPEHDTPERLFAYAESFEADPRMWTFLTGSADELEKTIVKGFKIAMGKEAAPEGPSDILQIFHGEHFVLVDAEGRIRGYYASDDDAQQKLVADVVTLSQGPAGRTFSPPVH